MVVEPSKIIFLTLKYYSQKEDIILLYENYIGYHSIPKQNTTQLTYIQTLSFQAIECPFAPLHRIRHFCALMKRFVLLGFLHGDVRSGWKATSQGEDPKLCDEACKTCYYPGFKALGLSLEFGV